jgi:hypothetical protein
MRQRSTGVLLDVEAALMKLSDIVTARFSRPVRVRIYVGLTWMIYDVRRNHLPLRVGCGVCAHVVRLGLIDRTSGSCGGSRHPGACRAS